MLCKHLGCDGASDSDLETDWPEGKNYDKMAIKCSDLKSLDHLWQCASPLAPGQQCLKRAAVTCTGRDQARRWEPPGVFPMFFINRSMCVQVTRGCGSWGTPTTSAAGRWRSKAEQRTAGLRSSAMTQSAPTWPASTCTAEPAPTPVWTVAPCSSTAQVKRMNHIQLQF